MLNAAVPQDLAILLLSKTYKHRETLIHTHSNSRYKVHSGIICDNRQLETTLIISSRRRNKYVVIFSYDRISIAIKMNKPPNTKQQQNKLKKFPTYDTIYVTFKNTQTIPHVA